MDRPARRGSGESGLRWRFIEDAASAGAFLAWNAEVADRIYFPLVNEAGALSWTSPRLHGGPALHHHAHLSPPLTAEDLPHTLIHRDFWITEEGRPPFSIAALSPGELAPRSSASRAKTSPPIAAGPGWWSTTRRDPGGRYSATATLWCPADIDEPLEIMRVIVTNMSSRALRFIPYAAIPLFCRSADNIRDHRHVTALLHRIHPLPHGVAVQPTMTFDERGHQPNTTRYAVLAFGPGGSAPTDRWMRERDFLGSGGTFAAPNAVWNRERAPHHTPDELSGQEAIGGFRFAPRTLATGSTSTYWLVSGIAADPRRVQRWIRWAGASRHIERSLTNTKTFWRSQARRTVFAAPDETLNRWLSWVGVQPTFRRLYGNSYLPQFDYGRGGRGWRDLWQDCLALLLSDPAAVRPTLLHNLAGIRIDGSNATIIGRDGSFIGDRNNIPRTWMDHGVWPAHTILQYLDQTGDVDFLFERQTYFRDPQLARCRRLDERWSPAQGLQLRTQRGTPYRGSALEHLLVQTLTAFFNVGKHNCCRLEGADWNDGLDMAPHRGESVAFSAFYAWNLKRLADLATWLTGRGVATIDLFEELLPLLDRLPGQRHVNYRSASAKRRHLDRYFETTARRLSGRAIRVRLDLVARDLMQKHDDLAGRIRRQEWIAASGGRLFNGYYDDLGRRVEGRHPAGMRMTLTGQVFPVMAGIATDDQVDAVIRSVNRWLQDPKTGGVRLNTDFREPQPHLGRAFFFAYGEKENGAVFSHMAIMYAYALYLRRRATEGRQVWSTLYRMATDQPAAQILPGLPEYFNRAGRGLYCYLTGSASWLISLLLTRVYGLRGERGNLVIDPQLTQEDFGDRRRTSVEAVFAGRRLRVAIANPQRLSPHRYAVHELRVDGMPLAFQARLEGGVRVDRAMIERLASNTPHTLAVTLSR